MKQFFRPGQAPLRTCNLGAALLLTACLLGAQHAQAQYHLDEVGLMGGLALPVYLGTAEVAPVHFGAEATGFYTHYFCGKKTGFWLEGGLRYHAMREAEASTQRNEGGLLALSSANPAGIAYHFLNVDFGAYLKFRPVNYHRDRETALLFGPALAIGVLGRYRASSDDALPDARGSVRDPAQTGVELSQPVLNPGLHCSFLLRRPIRSRKRKTWFLRAGATYYLLPQLQRPELTTSPGSAAQPLPEASANHLKLFVGAGLILWNSR